MKERWRWSRGKAALPLLSPPLPTSNSRFRFLSGLINKNENKSPIRRRDCWRRLPERTPRCSGKVEGGGNAGFREKGVRRRAVPICWSGKEQGCCSRAVSFAELAAATGRKSRIGDAASRNSQRSLKFNKGDRCRRRRRGRGRMRDSTTKQARRLEVSLSFDVEDGWINNAR